MEKLFFLNLIGIVLILFTLSFQLSRRINLDDPIGKRELLYLIFIVLGSLGAIVLLVLGIIEIVKTGGN